MTSREPDSLPELLTRPLADNAELRIYVQADLEQRMATATPGPKDDTAEQAVAKLGKAASSGRKSRPWLAMISLGLGVLWCVLAACEIPEWLVQLDYDRGSMESFLTRQVDRQRAAMLVPHPFQSPLWKTSAECLEGSRSAFVRHPDSAEYYYDYALRYWIDRKELPADFEATWKRLDPQNAIWPLLKMSLLVEQYVKSGRGGPVIIDPILFAETVARMDEALKLPLNTFRPAREHLTRLSYRHPRNWAEAKFIENSARIGGFPFLMPREMLITSELERLKALGDRQALEHFLAVGRRSIFRAARAEYPRSIFRFGHRLVPMEKAADLAGLVEERDKLRSLKAIDEYLWNSGAGGDDAASPVKSVVWALIHARYSPIVWAELIYRSRLRVLVVAAGLLLTLIVLWLRGLPYRGAANRCALCVGQLFTLRDSGATALVSAAVPALWLMACLAFMPPTSFESWPFFQVLVGSIFVTVLAALAQGARVSLARRAGILGFRGSRLGSIAWSAAVLLAFLSPLLLAALAGDPKDLVSLAASAIPGAIALLWLAGSGLAGFFVRGRGVPQRLLARGMIPAVLVLLACLAVCDIAMFGVERQVLSGDVDLLGVDPAGLASQLEDQAAFDRLEKEWQLNEAEH